LTSPSDSFDCFDYTLFHLKLLMSLIYFNYNIWFSMHFPYFLSLENSLSTKKGAKCPYS
jgi:hypothetical protein